MSAIARYLNNLGNRVYGYDARETKLTQKLESEGMTITYTQDLASLEAISQEIDMVVYTSAIDREDIFLKHFAEKRIEIKKRSEILSDIVKDKKVIAIAGTHGKTTISSMLSHILSSSSIGCSAFLGGISKTFNSNFYHNPESEYVVVEADEYDKSFLNLNPYYSLISSVDADHLDIYGSEEELRKGFEEFANKSKGGDRKLFINNSVDLELDESINPITYTIRGGEADYYAWNIRNYNGKHYFDLRTPSKVIYDLCLNHPGYHNVENMVVAAGMAIELGVEEAELREAVQSFMGVRRRFDIRINTKGLIYIDDYAHHPSELNSIADSVRELYPGRKTTIIFQPHLSSRTRDFADEFARALERFDEVVLLDVYAARETPLDGMNSGDILHKLNKMDKYYSRDEGLLDLIQALYPQVLITAGAGDIDRFVEDIENLLKEEE